MRDGALLGVLDLDSPRPARFDAEDAAGCEALAQVDQLEPEVELFELARGNVENRLPHLDPLTPDTLRAAMQAAFDPRDFA